MSQTSVAELPANIPLKTTLGLGVSSIIILAANTSNNVHLREFVTLIAPSIGATTVVIFHFLTKRIWFIRGNSLLKKSIDEHRRHIQTLTSPEQGPEKLLYENQLGEMVKLLHSRTMQDLTTSL